MNQRKSGVILSYISEGIKILSGLVYTPIMLRLLGQSEYGLYQLVYSVVSYLGLLSFGFTSSYMRFYSRYKAREEHSEISRLNGIFMTIFLVISVICLLCGGIMVGNIRAVFGDGFTDSEYSTARILMSLMVVNLALTFPSSVFDCFTSAHERFFFQKIIVVLQNLLNPFICLPLLIAGYGSVAMVIVATALTAAKFLLNMWYCLKKLGMKFSFGRFDFGLLKEMWTFTFFIFINQIIDQVNWSVDKFLLGRLAGTAAVAVYGLGGHINSMYVQFSTAVSNIFIPKVNAIVAGGIRDNRDTSKELTALFTRIGRIQFEILALILTGFVFFGKPFMRLWGGDEYSESYYVTLLLIVPVTVPLIQNVGIEIQRAMNKHKSRSIVYLVIAVLNVFISIPLIKAIGVSGAALGTAISLTIGNILFMNWYYHNRIGLDMFIFWKNIARFIPALILPCIAGAIIMYFFVLNEWFSLIVSIGVYTVIYSVSMWFLGMNEYEKNLIKGICNKLLRRRG